jgi:PAS domain S-box-containing protein
MKQVEPETRAAILVALPAGAVDMVPLGIVKIDPEGRLTYANRKMLQLAGLDDWRGRSLADLLEGEDLERAQAELRSRFESRVASEYELSLTRKDGMKVPLRVTAFPETNDQDVVIEALALVRDLTVEQAQQRMYKLVEQESDGNRLLDAIGEHLRPLVPFDRFQVVRLNKERTHLRTIYPCEAATGAAAPTYRWWFVPPAVRHFLGSNEILVINDLRKWYQEEPARRHMLEEPAIREFLAQGFVSVMSLPVSQNNEQVANIVLSRKAGRPFTHEERQLADALPLTEAVSASLRNETVGNLSFLLSLIKDIASACESVPEVAQRIVDRISEHYGWDHVSVYQAYEHRGNGGSSA